MSDRFRESDTGGTNVLVHTPPLDTNGESKCLDFLTSTPPARSNVLIVSYVRTPDEWLERWNESVGDHPARLGFVHVGDSMRSAATTASQSSSVAQSPDIVEAVASPTNLTGLGIKISEYLAKWEENENQTVVCFDSLTVLLQYTKDVQTTFQFLHTLIGRVQTAEARACYKITPSAHDDQTVATLTSLFDTVVE
ncbi:DUF7504 family protein [Haladaptatus sp. NG-SE-30]